MNKWTAVQLLARYGALIDMKDDLNGWTPLLFDLLSASRNAIACWLLEFGVPIELDEEVRLLRIRFTKEFPVREIIQNRKNVITTVLFDEELPFFSHLSPDVIRDIIDYTVTPILPALEAVSDDSPQA